MTDRVSNTRPVPVTTYLVAEADVMRAIRNLPLADQRSVLNSALTEVERMIERQRQIGRAAFEEQRDRHLRGAR